jgi:plasmid stabilization system protein ParE
MGLVFHRFIQRDLGSILGYYEAEAGPEMAKQFYDEFEQIIAAIVANPRRFHFIAEPVRRANFWRFPYHVLYRETSDGVRILVLRHHRRDPRHGAERQ